MARRPPSTAGSSRPYTSNGGRPTTAAGNGTLYDHHDPQYTYGDYDIEEEDEESEDEDVFAFLPPSTAEQQQQQQQQQLQQQHPSQHHYMQEHTVDHPSDQQFSHSIPSPHVIYPLPTYDPYARFPAASGVGPSTPQFQYFQSAPETPPSTDSNNHNYPTDHYRLQRLGTATSDIPQTAESREVRVSLPEGSQASATGSEKDVEMEAGISRRRHPKRHDSSITDSLSMGHSVLEDDDDETSRDGSIK
ncbi:hypothetical protein C0991_004706 [Blastosporella zonata]|nr:hypothetical protein C0991_004706 [Blastosporella zonata]